tara:strand:- start:16 stop:264 length:249 start_codon:yes stop_codon:yes gene_type:complete
MMVCRIDTGFNISRRFASVVIGVGYFILFAGVIYAIVQFMNYMETIFDMTKWGFGIVLGGLAVGLLMCAYKALHWLICKEEI